MNKKAIAIITGDLHFTSKKPIARLENNVSEWEDFQIESFRFIIEQCKKYDCGFISVGDFFDSSTELPYRVLNRLAEVAHDLKQPSYDCIGNHTLPTRNIEDKSAIEKSVWKAAINMRLFSGILTPLELNLQGINFYFIPYNNDESTYKQAVVEANEVKSDIIIMHKCVWSNEASFKNAPESGNAEKICQDFPDAKLIFSADNHTPFDYSGKNGVRLYNCGMPIRDSALLMDVTPRILVLFEDFTVESIPMNYDGNLTDIHIKIEKERKEKEYLFIQTINDSTKDISLNFRSNLNLLTEDEELLSYVNSKFETK